MRKIIFFVLCLFFLYLPSAWPTTDIQENNVCTSYATADCSSVEYDTNGMRPITGASCSTTEWSALDGNALYKRRRVCKTASKQTIEDRCYIWCTMAASEYACVETAYQNLDVVSCSYVDDVTMVCSGCAQCPNNATCTGGAVFSCQAGYALSADGESCEPIVFGCLSSEYRYNYNGEQKCISCPNHGLCNGETFSCEVGYHKYDSNTERGMWCCPNNAKCDGNGLFMQCNDGYYGNASDGCKICPSNAICSATAITGCNDGYILESDACNKCSAGEVCEGGTFVRCADGYYGSDRGNCKVCPVNGNCTGGVFNGCNSEYYGDVNDGCNACPTNAECNGGATFKCNKNYFKYTNETGTGCEPCGISRVCNDEGECLYCSSGYYGKCTDVCTKCPTLDGRLGTSVAGENTDLVSCSVSVTSSSTLNDGIGTYYFETIDGKCNASP